jgi:hypothetical protein
MKRAARLEFASGALEWNVTLDNLDDVDPAEQFFDKRFGDQPAQAPS